ncbi:MAG: hypothetical protein AAF654_13905 [Myxococcota bacterium]
MRSLGESLFVLGVSTVRGEGGPAVGLLRMTMPGSFGRMRVVPLLGEFCRRHPKVNLDPTY